MRDSWWINPLFDVSVTHNTHLSINDLHNLLLKIVRDDRWFAKKYTWYITMNLGLTPYIVYEKQKRSRHKIPWPHKTAWGKALKKSKKEKRHRVVTIHIAQSKSKLNYRFFHRKLTKFRKISLNLQRFFTKTLYWTSFSMRKKDYIWIMYKWATIHKNSVYKTLHLFTLQTSNTWGLT